MPKHRASSILWDYYEIYQHDVKIAECNTCQKRISYKTTITNLKQHLKLKHPRVHNDYLSRFRSAFNNTAAPEAEKTSSQQQSSDNNNDDESPESPLTEQPDQSPKYILVASEDPPSSARSNRQDSITYDCRSPSPTSPQPYMIPKKRKNVNKNKFEYEILNLEPQKKKRTTLQSGKRPPNPDMLFFESLVPYMAEIPRIQKLRLRSKIQDLVLSELESVQNGQKPQMNITGSTEWYKVDVDDDPLDNPE